MMVNKSIKARYLFIVLFVYVLIQFFWWAYLIVDLELTKAQLQLEMAGSDAAGSGVLPSKIFMVLGEGTVFLLLLFFGAYKLISSIQKEFEFAKTQNNFILSFTHELKTPIASVKLYLQTLQKRKLPPEKVEQVLSNSITETERLQSLVENILLTTRLESKSYELVFEQVNLHHLIQNLLEKYHPKQLGNRIILNEVPTEVSFNCDSLALSTICSNLLDNALKYSPNNAQIEIKAKQLVDTIELNVCDTGIGIPEAERAKVFNRFYRIGNEETRSSKGTGLGLFITKSLVNLLQGSIRVDPKPAGGSVFTVTLPRK